MKKDIKFLSKNRSKLSEAQADELIVKFIKKKFYNIEINIDFK